ncbi:PilZ domain-containing protein [Granulicella arctica]|uniref:PilZ domain-containing protein n=1 Tax=Granulicella arctica TaxID=940613 RepID=UPI0021E0FBA3|nr:PilZ domain-containing protein [Granulicella arctica]
MSLDIVEADAAEVADHSSEALQSQAERDRRENQRFPVEGWAEVMTMDGTMMLRGQITDISATGCFIESHGSFDLPMNSAVEMTFRIQGKEFRPEGVTRVVKSGEGAGFSFLKMNSKLELQIEALIKVLNARA